MNIICGSINKNEQFMRDDTDNKQSRCKYRDCSGENIPTQRMTFFSVKLISIFTELLTPKYKYIGT